jgi:RNA polymerase sigma-70 factor (ECF subfamily)
MEDKERDSEIIARFKGGERKAFEELVSLYEGRIYGYLARMCGGYDHAKDITQETFLTAYRYLDGFRGDASFKTWLYRVAYTACLHSRRRKKHEPQRHLSFEDLLPGEAERNSGNEWYKTPVKDLLNNELKEKIEESLRALPEKYRAVFLLKEREGFSVAEVAGTLDLSVPAVKSRLHRARLFLRKQLAEYYLSREGE